MAFVQEQLVASAKNTASTTDTQTIVEPTSGELIVSVISVDKTSGGLTVPSGFAAPNGDRIGTDYDSSAVSGSGAYKYSDSTETDLVWTLGNSDESNSAALVYSGDIGNADVDAQDDSGAGTTQDQTTGTTANIANATSLGIAWWGIDSGVNFGGAVTTSNSYTQIVKENGTGGTSGLVVGQRTITVQAAQESSCSDVTTADEMFGFIAVFNAAVAGGGRIMSSLAHQGGLAGMGGIAGIGGGLAG